MNESILNSVKKIIGLDASYNAFDTDLIIHINSVLMILNQLGVGVKGFGITGPDEVWSDFLPEKFNDLHGVKTYVALRTRLIFDPPTGGVLDALKQTVSELEWRLNVHVDPETTFEEE